ncbi:MAG TPA: ATP-binding protein [Streptosporangiaceae bacterium]|nr:ATP-binding protein [Streptosporangiaceae bacterium]
MRRVLGDTLDRLGVDEESVSDLLLAVTEACTNVLRHAGPGRRYEVVVKVGRNRCVLQVLDNGRGLDASRLRAARRSRLRRPPAVGPVSLAVPLLRRRAGEVDIAQLPESGRGLAIMQACVDDVSLRSGRGQGTVVQLRKRIELRDDAPLATLGSWALKDAG